MKTFRITALAALVAVGLTAVLAVRCAMAAPLTAPHAMIAKVLLRQNTNEAQVTLNVVDLGPSHKYGKEIFRKGVIIADDAGRMVAVRGEAEETASGQTYQVFQFDDMHIDMPGTRVIRVVHISLFVITGEYVHPDFICGSPSLSIDDCLQQWHTE